MIHDQTQASNSSSSSSEEKKHPPCNWDPTSELSNRYHNEEWGVPVHDDRKQFEFLSLEVMQCGLSWKIIMSKREILRKCFDNFQFDTVAEYKESNIETIMNTEGMIKSRRKIEAIINNAQCFQKIRSEFGTFSQYLWAFSGGKTILYENHEKGYIPTCNGLSDKISKDLKRKGFKFLGSITVYSHLQACDIINDHSDECDCYKRIVATYPTISMPADNEINVRHIGS